MTIDDWLSLTVLLPTRVLKGQSRQIEHSELPVPDGSCSEPEPRRKSPQAHDSDR